jgi:primosomal replication protein N
MKSPTRPMSMSHAASDAPKQGPLSKQVPQVGQNQQQQQQLLLWKAVPWTLEAVRRTRQARTAGPLAAGQLHHTRQRQSQLGQSGSQVRCQGQLMCKVASSREWMSCLHEPQQSSSCCGSNTAEHPMLDGARVSTSWIELSSVESTETAQPATVCHANLASCQRSAACHGGDCQQVDCTVPSLLAGHNACLRLT